MTIFRLAGLGMIYALLAVSLFAAPAPGDPKERAVAALEQAIQTDPNNAELWTHLGFAHRKMGQLDKAVEAFEKAGAMTSPSQEALFMLGLIYEKQNKKTEARRVWQRYLSLATDPEKRSVAQTHLHQLAP